MRIQRATSSYATREMARRAWDRYDGAVVEPARPHETRSPDSGARAAPERTRPEGLPVSSLGKSTYGQREGS
ncbi:hypothetical protein GCM10020219_063820 [Nonomuraea dietziae]